jgi:hypothetical protein
MIPPVENIRKSKIINSSLVIKQTESSYLIDTEIINSIIFCRDSVILNQFHVVKSKITNSIVDCGIINSSESTMNNCKILLPKLRMIRFENVKLSNVELDDSKFDYQIEVLAIDKDSVRFRESHDRAVTRMMPLNEFLQKFAKK